MIVYQATKQQFLRDAFDDNIEAVVDAAYRARMGHGVAAGEFRAWRESLLQMGRVMRDDGIPASCGVAVEYGIPQTSKRVDFIVTGFDEHDTASAIIVELKQWSNAERTTKDGIIAAQRGGRSGMVEGPHPSYQAWSYAALLRGFNTAVHEGGVGLRPCAYLHNYVADGVIDHACYAPHIERAPLFLHGTAERQRLQAFIRRHVRRGDRGELLYRLENGRIRPSRQLADAVVGLLQGKPEFVLVDDQKLVFETALQAAQRAASGGPKQVVIVQGGPGTGKSVVAVNLLARLTGLGLNTRYVSKNAAPRAVYESRLVGHFRKSEISNLFSGSGAFTGTAADSFDVLVVDEAHRLNEKSGLYGNLGEHQVKEVVRAARCTVFFVDDDQRVTLKDVGHGAALVDWARHFGADVTQATLASQFRCNGADGYLAWVDQVLGLRETANPQLDPREFDFRVFDSPVEMHAAIEARNRVANQARMVAGYCWEWRSKRDPQAWDIELPGFDYRRRWNLQQDGSLWIVAPDSVKDVGCIHTCQGLELDVVGVIVGPDLAVEGGRLVTRPGRRARSDKSLSGLKQWARTEPDKAAAEADRIVRNTYRTLFTRGMKGCWVWCTEPEVAAWLRAALLPVTVEVAVAESLAAEAQAAAAAPPFRVLRREAVAEAANAVPLVDLRFAAGTFGEGQSLDAGADHWVELPDGFAARPGLFVAQVVGESMNRRIPNGAWCLFRAHPQGTRVGKVVVAQHRAIGDPDLGGRFTVKVYDSDKAADEDGGWRHTRIVLRPDSTDPAYEPIVIDEAGDDGTFGIVAEWVATIG